MAALIAVAGGVIFWAWSQGANLISAAIRFALANDSVMPAVPVTIA